MMTSLETEIKTRSFRNLADKSVVNLIFTFNRLSCELKPIYSHFDITFQQYNVLRILNGAFPKSITPAEIKDVMLDKSPDLTRLIDRLVVKNYVKRCQNPDNRRSIDIWITEDGISLLKKVTKRINAFIDQKFKGLETEDIETFNAILDHLRV